ncbi:immune-associated nucleotide-binding protein 11-like, partial [Astyanax mexicanus]
DDPLFKELHLVIIGSHGSGKNDIGNAILRKKAFTSPSFFAKHYVKKERTVFGTKVTIVRAPGWSGELDSHENHSELKQEIKDAVNSFEKGPHAIILAIKWNSNLTQTTQATLEKLLTRRFWEHTIIISKEDLKKTNNENIDSLIEELNNRYCQLPKRSSLRNSKKLIEDIALMIAEKENVPLHFPVNENEKHDESHEKNNLLQSVRQKIQTLEELDAKAITDRTMARKSIKRLQNIGRIYESFDLDSTLLEEKEEEEEEEEKEESTVQATAEIHPKEASRHLGCAEMTSTIDASQNATEVNSNFNWKPSVSTYSEDDLRGWHGCLVNILEDLTQEQFKKMTTKICNMKDDRILRVHVENQNPDRLAVVMIEHWGEKKCIIYTRDILKDIPRNDTKIINLILPYLQMIEESW